MAVRFHSLLLGGVPLLLSGCLSFVAEGRREGASRPVIDSWRLETGRSTLAQTLKLLGPPDVLLRVGDVDRVYYVAWDSIYFKLAFSASLPVGHSVSADAFILGVGSEELRLVRLEYDRAGILRDFQRGDFTLTNNGEYVAIDNRVVEAFLEDRARALSLREMDDDEDLDR
jgi:hypothetical protein